MKDINLKLVLAFSVYTLFTFQCFAVSNTYAVHSSFDGAYQLFYWGSSILNVSALALISVFYRRFLPYFETPKAAWAGAVLCLLGVLISGLIPFEGQEFAPLYMASVLGTGIGTAFFYLSMATCFLRLGPVGAIQNVIASFFLALVANAFIPLAPSSTALIIVVMSPCVVAFLLTSFDGDYPAGTNSGVISSKIGNLKPLLAKLGLCIAAFSLVSGVFKGMYLGFTPAWSLNTTLALLAALAVAAVLLGVSYGFTKRLSATSMYRVVFFIELVSAVALIVSAQSLDVASAVQRSSGEMFRCLIFIFALRLCWCTALPSLPVFGLTLALSKVASFTVALMLNLLPAEILEALSSKPTPALVMILVLAFMYLYVFTEDDVRILMETNHVRSTKEANELRCAALTARAGLSPRESQVLCLYSEGKTLVAIAEELELSESTVSMYRKKIYAKLDIHSKQELLGLLEAEEGKV